VNYTIGLYIDKLKIESILEAASNDIDLTITDDILTQIIIYSDNNEEISLNVYKFKDETELYSIEPEYLLKTKTKYGIGYIYNVPLEDALDEDSVMIDMGDDGIRVLTNK